MWFKNKEWYEVVGCKRKGFWRSNYSANGSAGLGQPNPK